MKDDGKGFGGTDEAWEAVTNALGGLFCATLAPGHRGESVRTFGHIYPPRVGQGEGTSLGSSVIFSETIGPGS